MSNDANKVGRLPLQLAYEFLQTHGLGEQAMAIRESADRFLSYTSTLRRGKVIALLEANELMAGFLEEAWPLGKTVEGRREIERCKRVYERWQDSPPSPDPDSDDPKEVEEAEEAETAFVLESHLRDYLARNLGTLEEGLELWPVETGKNAVEFRVDGNNRRVDILARDREGMPVVIELKLHRGHERTLGQALYYRARVKELLGVGKVRIILVGDEITPELRAAASEVQGICMFEYRLSFAVSRV